MPRCKTCKNKFEPRVFLQKNCMENTECINAELEYKKELAQKKWRKEKKVLDVTLNPKKHKKSLQDEINKLSRMIDQKFGFRCIDCDNEFGGLVHGAHFNNVQGNENIRYNLHNIHAARAHCNMFSSEHKVGYSQGLKTRYGEDYYNYVSCEIGIKYNHIGLSPNEIMGHLKIVRKIIREFDSYQLDDSISARNKFNNLIGIYV